VEGVAAAWRTALEPGMTGLLRKAKARDERLLPGDIVLAHGEKINPHQNLSYCIRDCCASASTRVATAQHDNALMAGSGWHLPALAAS